MNLMRFNYSNLLPPLVGATRLRGIFCNPFSNESCIVCALISLSRLPVSVSGSIESLSRILELLSLGPGNRHIYHQPERSRHLGRHQNQAEKSSNVKPASRATKIMEIGSKSAKQLSFLMFCTWFAFCLDFGVTEYPIFKKNLIINGVSQLIDSISVDN